MPRPRKDQEGPSALERMEQAFWETLREKPYASMTVSDIVRGAGIHRNAFYYHYRDLDDMASRVVGSMLMAEIPAMLAEGVKTGTNPIAVLLASGEFRYKFDRVWLVAGEHGSPRLVRMLKDAVKAVWFEVFGIDGQHLSVEHAMAMDFVLGGITSLVAQQSDGAEVEAVSAFAESAFAQELFAAVIAVLDAAAEESHKGAGGGMGALRGETAAYKPALHG